MWIHANSGILLSLIPKSAIYTNFEVIMPEEIRQIVYDYTYMRHGKPPCSYKQKAEEQFQDQRNRKLSLSVTELMFGNTHTERILKKKPIETDSGNGYPTI